MTFVWCHSTAVGIELSARFGVPAGIDLDRLDAYLAEQSSHCRSGNPTYAMNAATSLFESLVKLRVLLAAGLLSGFAVLLTLRAPKALEPRSSK